MDDLHASRDGRMRAAGRHARRHGPWLFAPGQPDAQCLNEAPLRPLNETLDPPTPIQKGNHGIDGALAPSGSKYNVGAGRSSITRLLLGRHYPDAAHLALLNQFNKSNVGLVKRIVPHWGPSLPGFFTQPLIHCQAFFQNWFPILRQIF